MNEKATRKRKLDETAVTPGSNSNPDSRISSGICWLEELEGDRGKDGDTGAAINGQHRRSKGADA